MSEIKLKDPFFKVNVSDEKEAAYGGAQRWFPAKYLKNSACGVIACTNIVVHSRHEARPAAAFDREAYMKIARKVKHFLPIIPRFGINGFVLAAGIDLYFLFTRTPYRAFWAVSKKKMDGRIAEMLAANIPVCFAIGPNFPNLWGKHRVTMYRKQGENYVPAYEINSHYVSITGMDDVWYEISSWGERLYINKEEYRNYVKKHSSRVFSNILVVR